MSDTGFLYPGTVTSGFTNPQYLSADDNQYAVYTPASFNTGYPRLTTVKLRYDGSDIGDNKGTSTQLGTTETLYSFGGASDLWNATLTPSIINSSTFGVHCDVYSSSGSYVQAVVTNFGFSVPSGATINGVVCECGAYYVSSRVTKAVYVDYIRLKVYYTQNGTTYNMSAVAAVTGATSAADLARLISHTAAANGITVTSSVTLTVADIINLAAAIAANGVTSTAALARAVAIASVAAGNTITSTADLLRVIGLAGSADATTTTGTADLLRVVGLAASADAASATSMADLARQMPIAALAQAVTVTPAADLARLVSLAGSVDAVTTVSLVELLVTGLVEVYRRRIPDAMRVGSRGVNE